MQENVNAICMLCAFLAGTRNKGRNNLIERGKGKEAWLISMHAKLDDEVVGPAKGKEEVSCEIQSFPYFQGSKVKRVPSI